MKKNVRNPLLFLLLISIILLSLIFITYNLGFAPKTQVKLLTTQSSIGDKYLLKKFFPDSINFSLKDISLNSNSEFSDQELTDLSIMAINELPNIKKYVTGIKVNFNSNFLNFYFHLTYLNIPFEGHLTFSCKAEDGKGILHYEKGNLGLLNIPSNLIFNNLTDNSIIKIDKINNNIILNFDAIKNLNVNDMDIKDNSLFINFKYTISFWNFIKDTLGFKN